VAKRVSLDVVRSVVPGVSAQKRSKSRKDGPGRVPSHLVRREFTYFFQIRRPVSLAPCGGAGPPIRVRLGVLPRQEAQRRASWLGAPAQARFKRWRYQAAPQADGDFPCSDVGFPKGNGPEEFLANMLTFLEDAAAKIANPPVVSQLHHQLGHDL
jgi:hypothetical protein